MPPPAVLRRTSPGAQGAGRQGLGRGARAAGCSAHEASRERGEARGGGRSRSRSRSRGRGRGRDSSSLRHAGGGRRARGRGSRTKAQAVRRGCLGDRSPGKKRDGRESPTQRYVGLVRLPPAPWAPLGHSRARLLGPRRPFMSLPRASDSVPAPDSLVSAALGVGVGPAGFLPPRGCTLVLFRGSA